MYTSSGESNITLFLIKTTLEVALYRTDPTMSVSGTGIVKLRDTLPLNRLVIFLLKTHFFNLEPIISVTLFIIIDYLLQ